jgi:hypothetical protein
MAVKSRQNRITYLALLDISLLNWKTTSQLLHTQQLYNKFQAPHHATDNKAPHLVSNPACRAKALLGA